MFHTNFSKKCLSHSALPPTPLSESLPPLLPSATQPVLHLIRPETDLWSNLSHTDSLSQKFGFRAPKFNLFLMKSGNLNLRLKGLHWAFVQAQQRMRGSCLQLLLEAWCSSYGFCMTVLLCFSNSCASCFTSLSLSRFSVLHSTMSWKTPGEISVCWTKVKF